MSVRDARDQFGRLIDAAHYAGEITIVSRQGEPWAAIVPLTLLDEIRRAETPDTRPTGT